MEAGSSFKFQKITNNMAYRILLIEDEESIRETLKLNLELEDFEVIAASNGKQGLEYFHGQFFHLILIDVMMPILNGYDVCEQMRLTNTKVPIIFITAKDTQTDKITGLKKGADDYITKPFSFEELMLRIMNLLRRSADTEKEDFESYSFGDNKVNFNTFDATTANGPISLTLKESMLLKLLIERRGEVVSRQHILQAVWGYEVFPSTRTIDNFILAFRKYFEPDPREPVYFHSIRGVGYKFTVNN